MIALSFRVDGEPRRYSLDEMVVANAEDDYVLEWLRGARPGDVLREIVEVECLAEHPDLPPCPAGAVEALLAAEGYEIIMDDLARAWEGTSYTRPQELVPSIYALCAAEARS